MAGCALSHSDAERTLSGTGVAGPGGSEHKPAGRVCCGGARPGVVHTETRDFGPLGRAGVRAAAVAHGLDMLGKALTQQLE